MIFWQTPHALDIDPSTLLSFWTEPLVDWCAGSVTFSRGTRRAFCRTNAGRRVADEFRLEKKYVLQHQFSTYQPQGGADWCWLMVVGDWWPGIDFFFPSFVLLLDFLLYVLFGFFPDLVAFDPLLRPDHWSLRRGPMITPRRCWMICRWSWFLKSFAANQICTKSIERDGCFCWWIDLKLSVFSEIFRYSRQYSFKYTLMMFWVDLRMPSSTFRREQPTALSRRHGDGTCVPCYFHFQSQCLFGDKCGCCHHTSPGAKSSKLGWVPHVDHDERLREENFIWLNQIERRYWRRSSN